MEDKVQKGKKSLDGLEIDAFDLLEGKMNDIAIERLHKKISS